MWNIPVRENIGLVLGEGQEIAPNGVMRGESDDTRVKCPDQDIIVALRTTKAQGNLRFATADEESRFGRSSSMPSAINRAKVRNAILDGQP